MPARVLLEVAGAEAAIVAVELVVFECVRRLTLVELAGDRGRYAGLGEWAIAHNLPRRANPKGY
jgi:hypothetical protein